jgi:deoxyribodipyrimidine photo-lyase
MLTVAVLVNQLRVSDNRVLDTALAFNDPVLPIVCRCVSWYDQPWYGYTVRGPHQWAFWDACVADLANGLRQKGLTLTEYTTDWVGAIRTIYQTHRRIRVIFPEQIGGYEARGMQAVADYCRHHDIPFHTEWDWTLFDSMDMATLPRSFTPFRRRVEAKPHPWMPLLPRMTPPPHSKSRGETAAKAHLHAYIWESQAICHYKETRNQLMGRHFSSHLSAYLAHGCLSARQVYSEIQHFEASVTQTSGTYWLVFELLWREFFQWQYKKYADQWFTYGGIQAQPTAVPEVNDHHRQAWVMGHTADRLVNAAMNELRQTGWLSNRARQNAASYLIHDLNQDWRFGAAVFGHYLMDHDVANNGGNWMYIAGVGNSAHKRVFNVANQAERYDPTGAYRDRWAHDAT